jgi:hypothetical protein
LSEARKKENMHGARRSNWTEKINKESLRARQGEVTRRCDCMQKKSSVRQGSDRTLRVCMQRKKRRALADSACRKRAVRQGSDCTGARLHANKKRALRTPQGEVTGRLTAQGKSGRAWPQTNKKKR